MNKTIRRLGSLILAFCMILSAGLAENNILDLNTEAGAQLDRELGAFEITAHQRELAKDNEAGYPVLDAGRGNPNWINTQARYAFTRLMNYATRECELDFSQGSMAGHARKDGIGERFDAEMKAEDETDAFLISAVKYCTEKLGIQKDDLLKEWCDAIIGDYYPSPSRCLTLTEIILNDFLEKNLYGGVELSDETGIFPTEGGSAAMVYIFEALSHNRLLKSGDCIAIATPIFTPYLQIPSVKDYGLVSINVNSTAEDNWDIPEEELARLEDPSVKAFFLVNPSNPASHALSRATLERLKQVVEKNPDLIILTDDVYGTFAEDFQTVYSVIPANTILVYSFSKLYGATGWRLGVIAMNDNNVCDRLLSELSEEDKAFLKGEYSIVTTEPEKMKFLDRIVADSRSIGLYHTSGLSTPCQIMMDMFALTNLVCEGEDPYMKQSNDIVVERYHALMDSFGLKADDTTLNACYYTLVNVKDIAVSRYGQEFADWVFENMSEVDFLNELAVRKGVVLMYGPGFGAEYGNGTVRVSLANLNAEDYREIAARVLELLEEYYAEYEEAAEGEKAA